MADRMKAIWRSRSRNPDGTPAEFLNGIPAHSLTQEEWDLLSKDQQEEVEASSLYEVRSERGERGKEEEEKE